MVKRDLKISRVLISKTRQLDTNEEVQLVNMLDSGGAFYYYCMNRVDGLKDNEMILLAEPEFLGVIPIKQDGDDELYGIGVMNADGTVLVKTT